MWLFKKKNSVNKCEHHWKTTYWEDGTVANVYCNKCMFVYLGSFKKLGTNIKEQNSDSECSNTK